MSRLVTILGILGCSAIPQPEVIIILSQSSITSYSFIRYQFQQQCLAKRHTFMIIDPRHCTSSALKNMKSCSPTFRCSTDPTRLGQLSQWVPRHNISTSATNTSTHSNTKYTDLPLLNGPHQVGTVVTVGPKT